MKLCPVCKKNKEFSEFNHNKSASDGYQSYCKVCSAELRKAKREAKKETELLCSVCGIIKKVGEFPKIKQGGIICLGCRDKANKDYSIKYRSDPKNIEKNKQNSKKWREAGNRTIRSEEYKQQHRLKERARYYSSPEYQEKVKERTKQYKQNNPEKVKKQQAEWVANNGDKVREYHRERARVYRNTPEGKLKSKEQRKLRREKKAVNSAAYNARKYGNNGEISNQFIYKLHKWQDNCCIYCSIPMEDKSTLEHIVPLIAKGTNWPHNVVLACAACNSSKQYKTLDIWRPRETYPNSRYHSIVGTSLAFKELIDSGIDVKKENEYLILPNGKKLFVLSTFWISERLGIPPSINIIQLANRYPESLWTFDFEWDQRLSAIKNSILAKSGIGKSIGARDLVFKYPSASEARIFMDTWHIQGFGAGAFYYGLRDKNGEWYAMASVIEQSHSTFVLNRIAFRGRVMGGMSRLIKNIIDTLPRPSTMVTFADTRFGKGDSYSKMGFTIQGTTVPSFHYVNSTGLYHWNAYIKKLMPKKVDLYNGEWPLWKIALVNGLWKVDDMPLIRYVLSIPN